MIVMDTAQLKASLAGGATVEAASFGDVDWNDFAGENAHFVDCLFEDARFSGTVFASARFVRCRFVRCRFSRADLQEAVFEGCVFARREGDTGGCSFIFSDLRKARFSNCDLPLCLIERSDLFSIEMEDCNLRGARFQKADFSHAYSRKLAQTRATFLNCNLELADLNEARLAGCDLTGSRLRETDLSGVDLTDALLRDCDLFQAVMKGAKLKGADMRGANLSGLDLMQLASFAGIKIDAGQQHVLLTGIGIDVHPDAV